MASHKSLKLWASNLSTRNSFVEFKVSILKRYIALFLSIYTVLLLLLLRLERSVSESNHKRARGFFCTMAIFSSLPRAVVIAFVTRSEKRMDKTVEVAGVSQQNTIHVPLTVLAALGIPNTPATDRKIEFVISEQGKVIVRKVVPK